MDVVPNFFRASIKFQNLRLIPKLLMASGEDEPLRRSGIQLVMVEFFTVHEWRNVSGEVIQNKV